MNYDVIIIGAGPAGLAAGIYGVRAGLSTLVLDSSPLSGGQILNTYEIDNYPAMPNISGVELAQAMRSHAEGLGVEFAKGRVSSIKDVGELKEIVAKKTIYYAKAVIIATGASAKKLGCPGEDELSGLGVSYCATCDGAFFADKTVAVVGGGNVALEDALFLARSCEKVFIIHRRDAFRGDVVLQNAVKDTPNIEIVFDSVLDSIEGKACVKCINLKNVVSGELPQLEVDGVFIAIGTTPNTSRIEGLPEMDESGYIKAGEDCVTSIPGIYAAGDVRTKLLRQVVTATSDGANAISSVIKNLQA